MVKGMDVRKVDGGGHNEQGENLQGHLLIVVLCFHFVSWPVVQMMMIFDFSLMNTKILDRFEKKRSQFFSGRFSIVSISLPNHLPALI